MTAAVKLADPAFEPYPVETIPGDPACGALILCDHASNAVPPEPGHPGLKPDQFERHIAHATGAAAATRVADGGASTGANGHADTADPEVEERLRRLREQPPPMAEVEARRERERLTTRERAERAKTPLAAFAVSAATAVGGVLLGALRRRAS